MDLRQLKYFVEVMQCGSLTRAAAVLHLSQPTLGEHMRKLEDELGVELFVRHSRGITPTPAAELLRERASHMLGYARETRELLREAGGVVSGSVTFGVSPGLNEMFSADLIERCRARLPMVAVNVVEDLSAVLVARMARGGEAIDLALVSGFDIDDKSAIQTTALARESLYLVGTPARLGSADDPCAFVELAHHPLVLLGSGDSARPHGLRRMLTHHASALGITLDITGELRSISAVRDLVERDAGVTILPLASVRQAVAAGVLVARSIRDPHVSREIHLVEPANRRATAALNAVRGMLLELVDSRVDEPSGPLQRCEADGES